MTRTSTLSLGQQRRQGGKGAKRTARRRGREQTKRGDRTGRRLEVGKAPKEAPGRFWMNPAGPYLDRRDEGVLVMVVMTASLAAAEQLAVGVLVDQRLVARVEAEVREVVRVAVGTGTTRTMTRTGMRPMRGDGTAPSA